jgi:hypothetical protein
MGGNKYVTSSILRLFIGWLPPNRPLKREITCGHESAHLLSGISYEAWSGGLQSLFGLILSQTSKLKKNQYI